jgi:hypothetical protein
VEELYGTRYQSGSFSLIDVGSGFHCLRSFFLTYSVSTGIFAPFFSKEPRSIMITHHIILLSGGGTA